MNLHFATLIRASPSFETQTKQSGDSGLTLSYSAATITVVSSKAIPAGTNVPPPGDVVSSVVS